MARKTLTEQDAEAVASIGTRLYVQMNDRSSEIIDATTRCDPGRLADAIATAQADLAEAYARVTSIVARQR